MTRRSFGLLGIVLFVAVFAVAIGSSEGLGDLLSAADYVIIGLGGAGAPLARRLSDNPSRTVVVLEAGPNADDDPTIYDPNLLLAIDKLRLNWVTREVTGRDVEVGRMGGGSTSHNGMQYTRPTPAFCNLWEAYGGSEWSSAKIQQAFKEMENYTTEDGSSISSVRGTAGPLNVRLPARGPTSGPNSMAFKLANWTSHATGIPITPDYNDYSDPQNLFGPFPRYQLTQNPDTRRRESSTTAFLPRSVMTASGVGVGSRKLKVFFNTTAVEIVFVGTRAVGVKFIREGESGVVFATREVIVSSSVFAAQLLQNSGVGPADLLQSKGIPLVVNNTHVGKHLINHVSVGVPLAYDANDFPGLLPNDTEALYAGGAFLPDWYWDGPVNNTDYAHQPRKYQLLYFPIPAYGIVFFNVIALIPTNEGTISVQSRDPLQMPRHDENLFGSPQDLDEFAEFLYHGLQNTIFDFITAQDPSYRLLIQRWNSTADAREYLVQNLGRAYHYSSHARMAPSAASGVVDKYGKVFGTQSLRVAGSPIIPMGADITLAGTCMMTGWRIAQFILDGH